MSNSVEIAGEILAEMIFDFCRTTAMPLSEDWKEMLGELRHTTLSGNLAEREYWLTLYRRRYEIVRDGGSELASGLGRVVRELSAFEGDPINMFMIERARYGYLVWLGPDLSCVVSCLRVSDKRSEN